MMTTRKRNLSDKSYGAHCGDNSAFWSCPFRSKESCLEGNVLRSSAPRAAGGRWFHFEDRPTAVANFVAVFRGRFASERRRAVAQMARLNLFLWGGCIDHFKIHKYYASYVKQVKCGFLTSKASLGYTHCLRRNRRIN
uniref:Uncharacterized protein n=1 Tax=Romanomermis culicivorax TaxID=13658 RepID=A0A915JD64_ROMCU